MARYFFLMILIFALSCQNGVEPKIDDWAYFPISIGNQWTYDVTETQFSVTQEPKVITYLYREQVSQLIDEENQIYKLDRMVKYENANTWSGLSPILLKINPNRITIIGDKQDDDLLIFPLTEGNSWPNGELKKTIFTSTNYFTTSASQIVVQSKNDSSAIDLKRTFNVYEINKGLIHSENIDLAYCQETPDCIGKGLINSGKKSVYRLIEVQIN